MLYTLIGKLVVRGARFYLRRRYPDAPRKALIGSVAAAGVAAGIAGAVAAARDRSGS